MKVAVIFGGRSPEHEVSRISACNVLRWLDRNKYDVFKIGITKEGRWYLTDADYEAISDGTWEFKTSNRQVCFPCDPSVHGMLVFDVSDRAKVQRLDAVIPMLHGAHGEDGDVQGLLNLNEIPYVGSGVAASANSMDKSITKKLADYTGVRQAKYCVVTAREYRTSRERVAARIAERLGDKRPLFVKPASAGSSVGASEAGCDAEVLPAIENALKYDDKVLIEEKINGREMEIAVIGNDNPVASDVGEILSAGEFYDYDSKYNNPDSRTRVVRDLPRETIDEMRDYAVRIYKAMGCKGLSRVDFFFSDEGGIVFNEINTMPGFTNISMYPMLWEDAGVSGSRLLDKLIELALEEHSNW